VVAAVVCRGALDREDVLRLGDDADQPRVAPRIGADAARVLFGDREAARAEPDAILERDDRVGERVGVAARPVQQVEDEPRGGLRADRRQLAELVDQRLDGARDGGRDDAVLRLTCRGS
jgi:hypothetical protein